MSFLSITFLAALPLVAAPLLLHLFDRQRKVVVAWGAMQFLSEATARKTNVRRFQHWLLLLLRTLAVAALVFALARPLASSLGWGIDDRRETVLVIDNSLSTQRQVGEETVFDQLRQKAAEHLQELDTGATARLLVTSPYPAWVTPASVRIDADTRSQLLDLLAEIQPTAAAGDVPAALIKAVQGEQDDDRLIGRRIVLLTDGQREDWKTRELPSWERLQKGLQASRVPVELQIDEADVAATGVENLAVTRLRSSRAVVGVDQPMTMIAEIQNFSGGSSSPCKVTWSVGTEELSISELPALQSGAVHEVSLQHRFTRPGVYSIVCQLQGAADLLEADDREALVVEVVDRVPILLVEGSDGFAELQQDAFLVRAALGQGEENSDPAWRAVFDARTISVEQLDSIDLQPFRVVVIPNVREVSPRAAERLSELVDSGGGLWLAVGPRTDSELFNRVLFQEGEGLSPVAIARAVEESPEKVLQPTINPFLRQHPATAMLADSEKLDLGDVRVSQRLRWQTPQDSAELSVLLDLSNGDPLVVEKRRGRGRVIVQAIPLRFQWSTLAVSQSFVVMVDSWLGYLAEPSGTRHNLLPAEPLAVKIAGLQESPGTLILPNGENVPLTGEPAGDGIVFRTSRTALPGSYQLEYGLAGSKLPFQVARDDAESDLARLTDDDRKLLRDIAGLQDGVVAAGEPDNRSRTPLWPMLLLLLIGLIAAELILAGRIARKRFGTAPIEDSATLTASAPAIPLGMSLSNRNSRRPAAKTLVPEETRR